MIIGTHFARLVALRVLGAGLIGAAAVGPGGAHIAASDQITHSQLGIHSLNGAQTQIHEQLSGGKASPRLAGIS